MGRGNHIDALSSKEHNRKLLLRHILVGRMSRIQLAVLTGLTRAGTGVIVDSLIKEGLLDETVSKRPVKGCQPRLLSIRDDALYAAGINITRSGSAVGICGLNGKIIVQKSIHIKGFKDAGEISALLAKELEQIIETNGIPRKKIIGAGITTPGPVDAVNGIILNPPDFKIWKNYPVKKFFEQRIKLPVYPENNALARTLEEQFYGLGKDFENFVCLVVDNGVGGGVVINNKLLRGSDGFGGEPGHTTVDIHGERCYCGNIGCLELYVDPKKYIREARRAGYPSIKSWDEIAGRANKGEEFFKKMVQTMADFIGCGCVNLVNQFEPETVILIGELNRNEELLIKLIQDHVDKHAINRNVRHIRIMASKLASNQGVLAAAVVPFNSYLSSPVN
jgi:predicted NBD/HSP70 family sugar kinase